MADEVATDLDDTAGVVHSHVGPSSAHRWMNCTASVPLCEKIPRQKTTVFAAEGTAAHSLLAACLIDNEDAWEHKGELIKVENFPPFEVNDEMIDAVQEACDFVRKKMAQFADKGAILLVEQRVGSPEDPDAFGTTDVAILVPRERLLVLDFKYGKGIVIEPDDEQVRLYGHYTFETFVQFKDLLRVIDGVDPETLLFPDNNTICELYIMQNRIEHHKGPIRRHVTNKSELSRFFYGEALPAIQETKGEHPRYEMGSWCRYCPANMVCPVLNKEVTEFKIGIEPVAMSDQALGDELTKIKTILLPREDILKAEAFRRAMNGSAIPGWKLVYMLGKRIWKASMPVKVGEKDVIVTSTEALTAMFGERAWEPRKLLSPAKLEELPEGKQFAKQWAMKPQTGLTLAAESDRRQAQKSEMDAFSAAEGMTQEGAAPVLEDWEKPI
jgi:Protein of unknown function (DUF2800)